MVPFCVELLLKPEFMMGFKVDSCQLLFWVKKICLVKPHLSKATPPIPYAFDDDSTEEDTDRITSLFILFIAQMIALQDTHVGNVEPWDAIATFSDSTF